MAATLATTGTVLMWGLIAFCLLFGLRELWRNVRHWFR